MSKTLIHVKGTDLSSRRTAAAIRQKILTDINEGFSVVIDLTEVKSISESYADEAFGVIVANHGLNWFIKNIHIESQRDPVIKSIASAINRRLKNQNLNLQEVLSSAA
jgi:anti-anti-sigma regulatory factor